MIEKLYLGIDLGTSGIKVGLINNDLKIIFTHTENYPLIIDGLNAEQNPNDWWGAMVRCFNAIPIHFKKQIISISFSGQMHGMIALDEKNNIIRNAILWNDTRTFEEVKYLNEKIGIKKIKLHTGNIALEGFTAPKIMWFNKNENKKFLNTKIFLLPKDWLIFKLTGKFITDHSDASGTLLYDLKNKKWSEFMLKKIKIRLNQLPKIINSWDSAGKILEEIAVKLGVSKNIKIITGGADQAVNALSQGVINSGDICISLGTSGVIYAAKHSYKMLKNSKLHSFASVTGNYCQLGVTLAASGSTQWFAENILEDTNFDKLSSKLKMSKVNSILFLPYISGERTPINDPLASGTMIGLRRTHTKSDVFQGITDGIGFSMYQIFKIINSNSNANINKVYVSGGGAKNTYLLSIMSTLFNKKILVPKKEFGPFYGAALLAYKGISGMNFKDIKNKTIKINFNEITPKLEIYKKLIKKYDLWNKLYLKTKKISWDLMEDFKSTQI